MDPLSIIACLPKSPPHWDYGGDADNPGDAADGAMDVRIWPNLPQELLERILAALPTASLLRLRTVCKKWNNLIASTRFAADTRPQYFRSRTPCYLMNAFAARSRAGFAFYNPVLRAWHEHLTPRGRWQDGASRLPPDLVASAGGLLLLGLGATPPTHDSYSAFVVCDPISGAHVDVPPCPTRGHHAFVALAAATANAAAFKVVMAWNMDDPADTTTKIFDSATRAWTAAGRGPRPAAVELRQAPVLCAGCMYLVAEHPAAVVGVDLETGVWREVQRIPDTILRPHLVERHGRLAVVGGLDNIFSLARLPNPQALGIWRVEPSLPWGEPERLPKRLCKELQKWINFTEFRCTGQHDTLYLSSAGGQDVMAYDVVKKSWHWLPEAPSAFDDRGGPQWTPLPFEPLLSAPIL